MNRLASKQIGGYDGERNLHLLEIFRFGKAVKKIFETLVGSHAHARERPAAKIAEARKASLTRHFVERSPAGVGRGDQRANAGSGYVINGDFVLFQDAQNAYVRDTAGKPAA
jgi:hypothetical protein